MISCGPNLNMTEREYATFFSKCREEFETLLRKTNPRNPVYLAELRTYGGYRQAETHNLFHGFLMAKIDELPRTTYTFEEKVPAKITGQSASKMFAVSKVILHGDSFSLPGSCLGVASIGYALTQGNHWPYGYDKNTGHVLYTVTENRVGAEYVDIVLVTYTKRGASENDHEHFKHELERARVHVEATYANLLKSNATIKTAMVLDAYEDCEVHLVRVMITHEDFYAEQFNAYGE